VSQNKQYCTPASIDSIPSSNGQEDHVSMGANATTKLLKVVENSYRVLAIEWFTAAQAIELRGADRTSEFLKGLLGLYREQVPFLERDCEMAPLIWESEDFLRNLDVEWNELNLQLKNT
jgi:histidine ammonia-lyase